LYVYLSNESATPSEVFFDNFTVSVSESQLVQLIDYYPYGMVSSQWERTGEKLTCELFGKTYEQLTQLSDFHARHYDAALGRWHAVDPANQFASPYTGMGNNPVMRIDPDGRFAPLVIAAVVGVGAVLNVASNWQAITSSPTLGAGLGRALGFAAVGGVSGFASLYNPMAGGAIQGVGNALLGGVINGDSAGDVVANAMFGSHNRSGYLLCRSAARRRSGTFRIQSFF
jgi:RHS repeat-associated protein